MSCTRGAALISLLISSLGCDGGDDDDASGGGAGTAGSGGASGGAAAGGSAGKSGSGGGSGASGTGGAAGSGSAAGTSGSAAGTSGGAAGTSGGAGSAGTATTYDDVVLADGPVAYLAMTETATEPDLTGNGHTGSYQGGAPEAASLPNGDRAATFDGESQYLSIESQADLSIPTTGNLSWEAWIRPDTLEFPNHSNGYVDWLGKCAEYSPSCEWQGRLYNATNDQDRCNRFSAYAFNPGAGLGSGAYWQTSCGTIEAGSWYHVVGAYTLDAQPDGCPNIEMYPGSIEIWVNGVKWNQSTHGDTGCMSQYEVVPVANDSPLNVGTMAEDSWFQGAIGKLAIYDRVLTDAEIASHFQAMTGRAPTGSCQSSCSL